MNNSRYNIPIENITNYIRRIMKMETEDYYIRHIIKMVRGIKSLKTLQELYYELLWIKLNQ